jgi:hypothetical protein
MKTGKAESYLQLMQFSSLPTILVLWITDVSIQTLRITKMEGCNQFIFYFWDIVIEQMLRSNILSYLLSCINVLHLCSLSTIHGLKTAPAAALGESKI